MSQNRSWSRVTLGGLADEVKDGDATQETDDGDHLGTALENLVRHPAAQVHGDEGGDVGHGGKESHRLEVEAVHLDQERADPGCHAPVDHEHDEPADRVEVELHVRREDLRAVLFARHGGVMADGGNDHVVLFLGHHALLERLAGGILDVLPEQEDPDETRDGEHEEHGAPGAVEPVRHHPGHHEGHDGGRHGPRGGEGAALARPRSADGKKLAMERTAGT